MRGGSKITTNADTNANGGNINLDTGIIIQLENSDITANAVQGKGGNINISAQGIFRDTYSDITASSALGINGVINITTPDIKTENSLTKQSSEFVNAENIIASSCIARRNEKLGSFVITGTGGLQNVPNNNFDLDYAVLSPRAVISTRAMQPHSITSVAWKSGAFLKEATQLIKTDDGRLLLTAYPNQTLTNTQNLTCS